MYKLQHLEGSVTPVLYIYDARFLKVKALRLLYVPLVLTFKNSTFCPQSVYKFLYVSREKKKSKFLQHSNAGFYNWGGKCLLRGRTWVFNFFIIKPTRYTNFSNLFLEWNSTCFGRSSVHHQEFSLYTQQWYMLYSFAVCTVKNSYDGQRNCPKHVYFHSKNKFEKLEHLVCFIIRYLTRCTVTLRSFLGL
jgi:hypothetical protein